MDSSSEFPADRTDSSDEDQDLGDLDPEQFIHVGFHRWDWDEYQQKIAEKLMVWNNQDEPLPELSRDRGFGKRWSIYYHKWTNGNAIITTDKEWKPAFADDGTNAGG